MDGAPHRPAVVAGSPCSRPGAGSQEWGCTLRPVREAEWIGGTRLLAWRCGMGDARFPGGALFCTLANGGVPRTECPREERRRGYGPSPGAISTAISMQKPRAGVFLEGQNGALPATDEARGHWGQRWALEEGVIAQAVTNSQGLTAPEPLVLRPAPI